MNMLSLVLYNISCAGTVVTVINSSIAEIYFLIRYLRNNNVNVGKIYVIIAIFAVINDMYMKRVLLYLLFFLLASFVQAQFTRSFSSRIRSLQLVLNDNVQDPPVMRLGGDDVLFFSFDEMSHEYHRFTYKITHCNYLWEQSDIFEIDYLDGFNDMPIEDWENSENTTVLYTNYSFAIPNENVSLKLSGNYKVEVFDDDADDEPVAEYRFSVVEPCVALSAAVSGNTDIDLNTSHQQVSFTVHHNKYNIQNPANEIYAVVYQNRRFDNAVSNITPTHITGKELQYVYNEKLIFDGGNEYRRFELTNPNVPGMNVNAVGYSEPFYHASLYVDTPQRFHSARRDENGRYFINTLEGYGTDIEADYVFVHFALETPYRSDGDYYLLGDFCGNGFSSDNKLLYDAHSGVYKTSMLLKLGLYNYSYVWLPDGAEQALNEPIEGDFYDTDNEYLILIYHREFSSRYDKLIGVGRLNYKLDNN